MSKTPGIVGIKSIASLVQASFFVKIQDGAQIFAKGVFPLEAKTK